mmetsp:Transcript_12429/g.17322  ORF Transcript_12429/g.17322 Transcript_12429/m.17322 type:complete len:394 (+) Transcript_12429:131-1312(+)
MESGTRIAHIPSTVVLVAALLLGVGGVPSRMECRLRRRQSAVMMRLRGGGGDGGSTVNENREAYLELFKRFTKGLPRPSSFAVAQTRVFRTKYCTISGESLENNIVCCDDLGRMYDKQKLLEAMIDDSLAEEIAAYTFAPKHLTELILEPNKEKEVDSEASFCCPITGALMDGINRFVALKPSGYVVSKDAVIKHPSQVSDLIGTSEWNGTSIIPLNPTARETDALWERLLQKRGFEMMYYQMWTEQQRSMQEERERLGRKRPAASSVAADVNDDTERDASEEAEYQERLEAKAKIREDQLSIHNTVHKRARENDEAYKKQTAEEAEQEGVGALNFISRHASHFTNLDRRIADGVQAGGRGESQTFVDMRKFATKERRATYMARREGYLPREG